MKNLAISYLRYSSKGQATGDSERRQEESFNKWLSANSDTYELYQPFRDLGKSGYTGKHLRSDGSLGKLLQQTEDGTFKQGDVLVVEAIDRLSRQEPLSALDLFGKIVRAGLTILTLEDGQKYNTESLNNNASSLAILVYKIQAAHEYSKRLAERIKAAHFQKRVKASQGSTDKVLSAPWLKNGEIYEPIAKIVRHSIKMYLDGYGTRAIALNLAEYLKTADESVKKRYKKGVDPRTIRRWLANPALIGHWKSKEGLIENCFKPLIGFSDWMKIQNELQKRTESKVSSGVITHYNLSGLVKCKHCGKPFGVRVQKPRPTKLAPLNSYAYQQRLPIRYLNCGKYLKSGGCSNNATWPYQALDYIYDSTINECLFQLAMGLPATELAEHEINQVNERLAELEEKASRCRELFVDFKDEKAKKTLGETLEEIETLKRKLQILLEANNSQKVNIGQEFMTDGQSILQYAPWDEADVIGQKQILKHAGYEILIDGKFATTYFSNSDWELICRNQNSRTYTLKETTRINGRNGDTEYLAIDENGKVVAKCSTLEELSEVLDRKPNKACTDT